MADQITYFPVGNADMSLIKLRNGKVILIDCYLQEEVTDTRTTIIDGLISVLPRDENGRPYVDVFMLTHPDEDHCKGAAEYLHLAAPEDYNDKAEDKKIFVRKMWSSPLIFRRASKNHTLCEDAVALNKEAKRRVNKFKDSTAQQASDMAEGDKIRLIGSDWRKDDGTNRLIDLDNIRTKVGEKIIWSDQEYNPLIEVYIHGPLNPTEDENYDGNEETLSKNNSSIITQWKVFAPSPNNFQYNALLFGGDAEMEIWKRLWQKNVNTPDLLNYDLLLVPHHSSWGVLSSGSADDADSEVDPDARQALSQTRKGAKIISSSKPVKNDEDNPPAKKAKDEYISILGDKNNFICLEEHPNEKNSKPLKYDLSTNGTKLETKAATVGVAGLLSTPPPRAGMH